MDHAKAWAPGHITGFFDICDESDDILKKGSCGAGFSLSKGCTTTVAIKKSSTAIPQYFINNTADNAMVSAKVITLFFSRLGICVPKGLKIMHNIEVPFGAGFGSSGAGAFSLSLALNKLYGLPLSDIEAGQIAHVAEAECKTGLGTVLGDTVGGIETRTAPGAPGIGEVLSFPQLRGTTLFCCVFGPLSTTSALSDPQQRQKIREAYGTSLQSFLRHPVIAHFMLVSRNFAEQTGFITNEVRIVLNLFDKKNIPATMPMFGEAVYTIADISLKETIMGIFAQIKKPHTLFESTIAEQGAHVIDEH